MIAIVCFPFPFFLLSCDQLIALRVTIESSWGSFVDDYCLKFPIESIDDNFYCREKRWHLKIASDEEFSFDFNLHSSLMIIFGSKRFLSSSPDTLQTPELKSHNFWKKSAKGKAKNRLLANILQPLREEKVSICFQYRISVETKLSCCCVLNFLISSFDFFHDTRSSHSVSSKPALKYNIID